MSPDNLADARKELDKEYGQVRESLASVEQAFQSLMNAGPEDDLSQLLEALEDSVREARTGGLLGSGARGHRKALEEYLELKVK
jgi:hypothetical protein